MVQNISLPFWKMLAYTCQIEILQALVRVMLILNVENILPIAPHHFAVATTYSIAP